MGFDFFIEYKKGNENNFVADALSRRAEREAHGELGAITQPIPNWVEAVKEEAKSNPVL